MRYHGVIETLLSKYASLSNDDEQLTSLQLAKTSKELLKIINGNHFGNDGYIKYVLSMIKEVIDANQIILQGKDKVYFKLGEITNDKGVEKIFYIRNTNFKVCINTKEAMDLDRLMKIGSFLDLTGMFLSTLDEESTIAKNYIDFLYDANKLLEERENNYLHSEKVNIVVVELAKKLFLSTQEMEALSQAAMLHDIGSMQDLDDMDNEYFDETNEHKLHPLIGAILMEPVGNIYPITNIIKYHHERLDGKGYPFGLVGNKIPILSQILGLAEYYVGLISERSIEMGMNYEGAISLMEKSANRMFDNVLVETFLIIHEDVKKKITQLEIKAKLQEGS
jgi:HD-GYP domain-containing protein (c-di-GMP phosphodiesterase class II)